VDGKWVDVFKDPIGDSGKRSKKGRVTLTQSETGQYSTVVETPDTVSVLKTVFENGNLITEYSFDEVRTNSKR
jgi:nicotinamide phosphoribosyltransferase